MSKAHVTGFDEIAEFAAQRRKARGPVCRTCSLPADLLTKIHDTRDNLQTEFTSISAWLKEKRGLTIPYHSLQHHFQNHRG